ncbi:uncharacterized protein [Littorina saxatilis]|uniref:C2H2-type domain-containing protein n=1 Tax=Littorina saxatilis TaxID=31220 RepID=A0AAN9GMS6_9CAEN
MDADDSQESACRKRIQYKSYDSSQMEKAMTAVQYDGKTMYRAAKEFKVPMNTLRDRLIAKGLFKPKTPNNSQNSVIGKRKRLSDSKEKERTKAHITLDDDILERWREIGTSEGLTSNAAITRFLVSLYYKAEKEGELKSDIRCHQCHNPLTLFCVNCQLISQATPPQPALSHESTEVQGVSSVAEKQSETPFSPQSDCVVKAESVSTTVQPTRRSTRRKKPPRSCEKNEKPKVQEPPSSDEEQAGFDDNHFLDQDWPEIEDTARAEDGGDVRDDPAFSLDELFNSFEEESLKKPRVRGHECPQCHLTFTDLQELTDHFEETKHISEYLCQQCDKSFKNKSALRQHSRVHNRQEHQCAICGLSFKFPSRLNKHIKTHGTDKPHVCDKCGKSFVSVYYLRDHIKIHSEERRYKCEICGAAFKQKPALYAHGKKHTNEKPFQCQYCGLKFRDSQKVKIHVRTHTGEKPYKCGMCDATFVSNSNMWQHCAYVHGKSTKTHPCTKCPLTFAAKGKLKVHMKNTHAEPGEGEGGEEVENTNAVSCQFAMMRQTMQSMYIEIQGGNQLVQL